MDSVEKRIQPNRKSQRGYTLSSSETTEFTLSSLPLRLPILSLTCFELWICSQISGYLVRSAVVTMKIRALYFWVFLAATAWSVLPGRAFGQVSFAAIKGTITDPSGNAINDAKVAVLQRQTGIGRVLSSGANAS